MKYIKSFENFTTEEQLDESWKDFVVGAVVLLGSIFGGQAARGQEIDKLSDGIEIEAPTKSETKTVDKQKLIQQTNNLMTETIQKLKSNPTFTVGKDKQRVLDDKTSIMRTYSSYSQSTTFDVESGGVFIMVQNTTDGVKVFTNNGKDIYQINPDSKIQIEFIQTMINFYK